MNTKSIYLNNDYSKAEGVNGKIGACGMELSTVENLLTMGYQFCNHVCLVDRQRDLIAEIDRLEKLRKTERNFMFVPVFG
jgi:hypothetical protein